MPTTTLEIYKTTLNQILNSDANEPIELKKIALKAFADKVKQVVDAPPMNWMQYENENFDWHLYVNEVPIACLVNEDMDGKKWTLTDYGSDFAPIFGGGSMPDFDSIDEGKKYCEMRFLLWLKDSAILLRTHSPKEERSSVGDLKKDAEALASIRYREARNAANEYAEREWNNENDSNDLGGKDYARKDFLAGVDWLRNKILAGPSAQGLSDGVDYLETKQLQLLLWLHGQGLIAWSGINAKTVHDLYQLFLKSKNK